ncbi:MAG: DUF6677 family protein [Planctomycetota bacterium]|nr:DUF6677 family protein [Planctomycetota bacterium]
MTFSEVILNLFPVFIAAGVAYFLWKSNARQRIAVVLAWAFPGAGHWWLGHQNRAKFFAFCLVPTFLAGMALSGFLNISPIERHPIWALAQAPGGLMTLVAWLATMSLKVTSANDYYLIGCLYSGSACLLNLIAMCDVWDLAETPKTDTETTTDSAEEAP